MNAYPPHFLGIGVSKCGTTWLDRVLRRHPAIWMPQIKELHFFDEYFFTNEHPKRYFSNDAYSRNRWRRYLRSELKSLLRFPSVVRAEWTLRFLFARRDFEWYVRLFPADGKICGEITPAYALLQKTHIVRIHQRIPQTKIILQLRNPIDRAWSHARMELAWRRNRNVNDLSFAELEHFLFEDCGVISRGRYSNIIPNWHDVYGEYGLFIGIYDDMVADGSAFVRRVLDFIGADCSMPFEVDTGVVFSGLERAMPDVIRARLAKQFAEEIDFVADYLDRPGLARSWRDGEALSPE